MDKLKVLAHQAALGDRRAFLKMVWWWYVRLAWLVAVALLLMGVAWRVL